MQGGAQSAECLSCFLDIITFDKLNLLNMAYPRLLYLLLFLLIALSGCSQKMVGEKEFAVDSVCPEVYTFHAGFQTVWDSTVQALSEDGTISSMDEKFGVITTDFETLNKAGDNLMDTMLGAKTYTYSYTVHLLDALAEETKVKVNVDLKMSQFVILEMEEDFSPVESYLRKKLYEKICMSLQSEGAEKCEFICGEKKREVIAPLTRSAVSRGSLYDVQKRLDELDYNPGPVDGVMGRKTRNALRNYQKDNNLKVTGQPDENTKRSLGLMRGAVVKKTLDPPQAPKKAPSPLQPVRIINATVTTDLKENKDQFSSTITVVDAGSELELLETEGEWLWVQYEGKRGYINIKNLMEGSPD